MAFEITAHLDKFDEIKDHTIYYWDHDGSCGLQHRGVTKYLIILVSQSISKEFWSIDQQMNLMKITTPDNEADTVISVEISFIPSPAFSAARDGQFGKNIAAAGMTSRWRGQSLVNFSARSGVSDPRFKNTRVVISTSSAGDYICIFFFFRLCDVSVSARSIPLSTCQRHGDTRRRSRPKAIEMETNDRNPRVFPYRARILRDLGRFRLVRVVLYHDDKSRIREMIPGNRVLIQIIEQFMDPAVRIGWRCTHETRVSLI